MTRAPRSLLIAARDVAVLAVITFAACVLITGWSMQWDNADFARRLPYDAYPQFTWSQAVGPSITWTLSVLGWVLVVWCATRTRAGRRGLWVPGALAVAVVVVRAAATIAPPDNRLFSAIESWPGPYVPFGWELVTSLDSLGAPAIETPVLHFRPGHPGWSYPVLVVGMLAAAGWLGARAGRRLPDDRASRSVAAVTRGGAAAASVVIGLPVVGAIAGTALAYLAESKDSVWMSASDTALLLLGDIGVPVGLALIAVLLLSGTGPLGVVVTAIVSMITFGGPLRDWWAGGDDLQLARAAGIAAGLGVAALWRPAAAWAGEILAPARAPSADEWRVLAAASDSHSDHSGRLP